MTKLTTKIFLLLLLSFTLSAQETVNRTDFFTEKNQSSPIPSSAIQSNEDGVAIDGFDPVAYFDKNKAVKGSQEHSCEYLNTTWHFSSAENRDKFLSNPEKFIPQYGGYCAHSLNKNKIVYSNPESFVVRDNKLYLYVNDKVAKKDFKSKENIFAKKKSTRDNNWLTYQVKF